MSLLTTLLALCSCKHSPEVQKAEETFTLQSLLTYEYCGEKEGFQYFLLGNSWERKEFKIKSSEINIASQYIFPAKLPYTHTLPITLIEQREVFAEIPANGQKLYLYDEGIVQRYFLNCSDLNKQKTDRPTYLYNEITQEEAEAHGTERAYYIGYYKGEQLIRYKKVYRGEVLMEKIM